MQCEEFEARLNAVLDERQRPQWDAELCLHRQACVNCRQLAAAYEILLDGFYELAAPEAPPDMALRVVSEMRVRPPMRHRVSIGAAVLATAAGLLIAIVPWLRNTSNLDATASTAAPAARTNGGLGAARHAAAAGIAPLEQLPIVPDLFAVSTSAGGGDAYAELARETGQNLATVMLYVPGIGGAMGIIDADTNLGADESTWTGQMSEGLRPVSDSVAETLNLLLDSLPVTQVASRS
jgi:hypothetical protein